MTLPALQTQGTLEGKTIVMSGGSRGIGLAIALRAARDGANVVLLAKTDLPDPRLNGTIHDAAAQIEAAGGRALAVVGDVRSDDAVADAAARAVDAFGGIDICVNNASALRMSGTLDLTPSQYDLMQDINTRGAFMLTRACLPHLRESENPHVLTLSPPLNVTSQRWLAEFPGYLLSKYGMSLVTLTIAAEFAGSGVAANSLWPRTTIGTDAVRNLLGGDDALTRARRPEIMADAAYAILTTPSRERTGQLLIDDDVLREVGVTDFSPYAYSGRDEDLDGDFFLD
ncbi:NAD(P)-dependent oxidoreductase [Microbacterium jejuense]|uniref:SDR family oxidoreductase n=1 Tax=Microbacterium jejuense TaxID=1263637 RepID=UPI0031EB88A6